MKAFRKIGLFFLSLTFAVAILGCDKKTTITTTTPTPATTTTSQLSELEVRLHSIYQLGFASGAITESYDDWLASIRGENGEDGREVLLRVSGGYVQWQYSGDASWQNLIAVSALTGPAGTNGTNGTDGTDGTNGTNGTDGREVTFRISEGYLQWQYVGDSVWTNLLSLAEIAGTDGTDGTDGTTPTIAISEDGFWVINGLKTAFRAVPAEIVVPTVDLWFDLNGGTLDAAVAAQYLDIPKGDTVTLPIPEKHGYVFAGWFTGDTVNDGQFLNTSVAAKDLTLHARWAADTRGIELLLSQLVSGTNFVIDYTQTEKTDGDPDQVENWRYSSSMDETGKIHREETGVFLSGTDILGNEFRSSLLIDGYEYYYFTADDGEFESVGKRLHDSRNRKMISWDVPKVDSIYEYFRIEDFRIRPNEFVLDFVPSDDGLIAYAHAVAGSDVDDDNLKAVFYGDTGIFEITIPEWDDGYETIETVLVQTFRLVSVGTSANRFLFSEYRAEILSDLEDRTDARIALMLPTEATLSPFLDLKNQLVESLGPLTDPVLLWEAYVEGINQLETFPLVTDPEKVAAEAAKVRLDEKLAELCLTATDASILAMQALLPAMKAELLPAPQTVLDAVLAGFFLDLEALYVADPVKIEYLEAKERVFGYLYETWDFFGYILSGYESQVSFQNRVDAATAAIDSASTAEAVYAVWDGFGATLETADLNFEISYPEFIGGCYEEFRWQYWERTSLLLEEGTAWSSAFDTEVLSDLHLLPSASVYEYMHDYIALRERMDEEYRSLWFEILMQKMMVREGYVFGFATPEEKTLFLNTFAPLYASINDAESGEALICLELRIDGAYDALAISDLTRTKIQYMEYLVEAEKNWYLTATADSRSVMNALVADYSVYLGSADLVLSDVTDGYYQALEALHDAYDFDSSAIALEEARKEAVLRLEFLRDTYEQSLTVPEMNFRNDVEEAIHQVLVSADLAQISVAGTDLFAEIAGSTLLISQGTRDYMELVLQVSIDRWETEGLDFPSSLYDQVEAFLDSLYGYTFGSSFTEFLTLYSDLESAFWGAASGKQIAVVEAWYDEKSAIAQLPCLAEMESRYQHVLLFLGLSRDEFLWQTVLDNFQMYLIDCPTDPIRLDRKQVSDLLLEEIIDYDRIVTSSSMSAMVVLYDEFVALIEGETDRDAMDALLSEYSWKLLGVYDEDFQKAAFLNLKDYYGVLFSAFGDILYGTLPMTTPEQWDADDRFQQVLNGWDALSFSLTDPEPALQLSLGELLDLYQNCGGSAYELTNLDYLSERIEYLFYDYATAGTAYLDDQLAAMDALRETAQSNLLASSGLLGALTVYADYVEQMKSLAAESHRDFLLSAMLDSHDGMFYRLPAADRSAFTATYLTYKARLQNAKRESSFDIIDTQFAAYLGTLIPDPVFAAKRSAIESIQLWLAVKYWVATDDSRTALYSAQTAAYDAIYAATTVEEADSAYDAGMIALEAAYVEDPVRVSLYDTEMNQASMELSQLLSTITYYSGDIRELNQALLILRTAEQAVWTANDSAQLAAIVSDAKTAVDALGLSWNDTIMEEERATFLNYLSMILSAFVGPVPSEVQTAYNEAYSLINGATDPFTMIEAYEAFGALAQSYL